MMVVFRRFTTVLAETARWVHSTDFIESFIAKNQERNTHMGNISYQIGDAVHLQMDEKRYRFLGGQQRLDVVLSFQRKQSNPTARLTTVAFIGALHHIIYISLTLNTLNSIL